MQDRFKFNAWDKKHNKMYYEVQYGLYGLNFSDLLENEDFKIIQCTGLKDKNGKLIYEGDILRINNRGIHPVEYMDCYAQFHIEGHGVVESFFSNTYEIIGNIYENLELLEVEQCQ